MSHLPQFADSTATPPQHTAITSFAFDEHVEAAPVRYRKPTVAEVLSKLPADATELQKDSALRKQYPLKATTFQADRPDYDIPGLVGKEAKSQPISVTFRDHFFAGHRWLHTEVPYRPKGISGDPIPYRFRTDSVVTLLILIVFFLATFVVARSYRYLIAQVKDFFHTRSRENMFTPTEDTRLHGSPFLIFQTCFVLGIVFFDYTQNALPHVFNQISPYVLLTLDFTIFFLYYIIKIGLYNAVNSVFFDRNQNRQWNKAFLLTILGTGLLLFPVALLVVYFDLSFHVMTTLTISIVTTFSLLRLYKSYTIFFTYNFGWVHIFLYFCATEIAPLLILWRILVYSNEYLTINF